MAQNLQVQSINTWTPFWLKLFKFSSACDTSSCCGTDCGTHNLRGSHIVRGTCSGQVLLLSCYCGSCIQPTAALNAQLRFFMWPRAWRTSTIMTAICPGGGGLASMHSPHV